MPRLQRKNVIFLIEFEYLVSFKLTSYCKLLNTLGVSRVDVQFVTDVWLAIHNTVNVQRVFIVHMHDITDWQVSAGPLVNENWWDTLHGQILCKDVLKYTCSASAATYISLHGSVTLFTMAASTNCPASQNGWSSIHLDGLLYFLNSMETITVVEYYSLHICGIHMLHCPY